MAATSIIPLLRADEAPVETVSYNPAAREGSAGKYLTFRVARQDFALKTEFVRAILPLHELVALEVPHESVRGFATVGGHHFSVIDLRAKLEIPHGSHGREPVIIVVAMAGRLAGFVADRVSEVLDVRQRDFRNGALRGHGRPRRVLDPRQVVPA
jgi:chemotaxis signal transduction protein